MDALQESGWEELRKEARKVEGDLDVKLSSYAKLGARSTQGGKDGVSFFSVFFLCSIANRNVASSCSTTYIPENIFCNSNSV